MATKTIVRYKPPNELVSGRQITVEQLEAVGIFDHGGRDLVWRKETGFWLDAEEAGIPGSLLDRIQNDPEGVFSSDLNGHLVVEKQEVRETTTRARSAQPATEGKGE